MPGLDLWPWGPGPGALCPQAPAALRSFFLDLRRRFALCLCACSLAVGPEVLCFMPWDLGLARGCSLFSSYDETPLLMLLLTLYATATTGTFSDMKCLLRLLVLRNGLIACH